MAEQTLNKCLLPKPKLSLSAKKLKNNPIKLILIRDNDIMFKKLKK